VDRLASAWPTLDAWLYPAFAGAAVLVAATAFYGSLRQQTHGAWSAPLDDVFIHFDYARATARGYPFQWSEGNGYSSGNTSVVYPFVLAFGYWIGFNGLSLMFWAALVACVSTLGFLTFAARLFEPLGAWAKYLAPPAVLSLGALAWSLFSGMENAFHLALWGATFVCALAFARDPARPRRLAWATGALGALLFATRPESVVCVAAFAAFAALQTRKTAGARQALATLTRVALPGALVFAAMLVANRIFTGEWAQNGAIAKLPLADPYMTAREKWATYAALLKYVVLRNTQHHFADAPPWGWLVPAVAAVPFFTARTRAVAALLWAQILGWLALVALNGQVRWQNERYTMAAVAWTMLLFALGIATIARGGAAIAAIGGASLALRRAARAAGAAAAVAVGATYWHHQAPNLRDQIWFFGRAARNIRDQHLRTGVLLLDLRARRVLVGDAGAVTYASDRPGLDLLGLGGYRDLPFARASVHGLGASLELIERMPKRDRPDFMAIYPSWWGDLPAFFGREVRQVPVIGNVICGASEKVIYRADWGALDRGALPLSLRKNEVVVDELDVADLVSEREHAYAFPSPRAGYVELRVLPDPNKRGHDVFDAGRRVPEGAEESAVVRAPRAGGRLVLRTIAAQPGEAEVRVDGRAIGRLRIARSATWSEPSLSLPPDLPPRFRLSITATSGDLFDTHLWIIESAGDPVAGEPSR
jgi:hypothetical protein